MPQQYVSPRSVTAHVCAPPEFNDASRAASPFTWIGTDRAEVVPSPSWPKLFAPQHHADASLPFAQVKYPPAVMVLNGTGPLTTCGVEAFVVLPEPSWPLPFRPQHHASPVVATPQE